MPKFLHFQQDIKSEVQFNAKILDNTHGLETCNGRKYTLDKNGKMNITRYKLITYRCYLKNLNVYTL